MIFKRDQKKRTIWITGPPNSGKSCFLRLFQKIFPCQNFDFRLNYCCMGKKSKQGIKPQVYTCEEFNQVDAFDRNMVTIKQLFEGQGSQISKNKYQRYENDLADGYFLMASNDLLPCSDLNHPNY